MKNVMKTALIAATVVGGLSATAVSAQSTALQPVERFVVSDANRAAFDANLTKLGVSVQPGDTLTGKDRDFALRVMNSNVFDSTKASIIRALYADENSTIRSNGLF